MNGSSEQLPDEQPKDQLARPESQSSKSVIERLEYFRRKFKEEGLVNSSTEEIIKRGEEVSKEIRKLADTTDREVIFWLAEAGFDNYINFEKVIELDPEDRKEIILRLINKELICNVLKNLGKLGKLGEEVTSELIEVGYKWAVTRNPKIFRLDQDQKKQLTLLLIEGTDRAIELKIERDNSTYLENAGYESMEELMDKRFNNARASMLAGGIGNNAANIVMRGTDELESIFKDRFIGLGLILDKEIALKLIKHGFMRVLSQCSEKFEGLDKEVILAILDINATTKEDFGSIGGISNIVKNGKGLDREIAIRLIEYNSNGASAVIENIERFEGITKKEAKKLIKDRFREDRSRSKRLRREYWLIKVENIWEYAKFVIGRAFGRKRY
ncbi:MAG TPA: hypothetical protein ENI70_00290 [Candidatus Peregrinibacteria bacterium]|nr:hypothetical protein [Candidatus Peregrinibacteria bacterium]